MINNFNRVAELQFVFKLTVAHNNITIILGYVMTTGMVRLIRNSVMVTTTLSNVIELMRLCSISESYPVYEAVPVVCHNKRKACPNAMLA